jgi:hypothetical protein
MTEEPHNNNGLLRLIGLIILAALPIIPKQDCAIVLLGHAAGCTTHYVSLLSLIFK